MSATHSTRKQHLMTASESLIGTTSDDPLRAAKRSALYMVQPLRDSRNRIVTGEDGQPVRRYAFNPLPERRETLAGGYAGPTYRLFARMVSRASNDSAVVSVLTDGRGGYWGYETVETGPWAAAFGRDAYWLAAKAVVEANQESKRQAAQEGGR